MGVSQPTHIQTLYIPPILSGKDVIIRSQTGSGKTLGIVTSVVEKTLKQSRNENRKGPHTIIITPTRELAWQITMWIRTLLDSIYADEASANLKPPLIKIDPKHSVQMLVGGVSISRQLLKLSQHNPHIIVATSSRLKEIIEKIPSIQHNTEQTNLPFSNKSLQDIISDNTPSSNETDQKQQPKYYTPLPNTEPTPQKTSHKHTTQEEEEPQYDIPPNFQLSFKSMKTLIVDEVDLVVNSLSRYATSAQYKNRQKHPPTGIQLLEHIKKEVAKSPEEQNKYQTIISSATVNSRTRNEIKKNKWMRDDAFIADVGTPFSLPSKIKHQWIVVHQEEAIIKAIKHCYELEKSRDTNDNNSNNNNHDNNNIKNNQRFSALILMDGMASYKGLLQRMLKEKLSVGGLSYAIDYEENDNKEEKEEEGETPFEEFMAGKLEFLAASETSIRGLDIPNLTHVFILGAFYEANSYLHMAGRTGRMGKPGKVVSIFTTEHLPKIALEMKYIGLDFKPENFEGGGV